MLIALTPSLNAEGTTETMARSYCNAIAAAGAMPVILPMTEDPAALDRIVAAFDGFCFTGGLDVDPLTYGEQVLPACGNVWPERDNFEMGLARRLVHMDKPVLGICRGNQVLNVALGGSLYQDVYSQIPGCLAHQQKHPLGYHAHPVDIAPDSLLRKISGADTILVNSHHHQAVKDSGQGLVVTAHAPDGVIEAFELSEHPFFVGVQWHPERLWQTNAAAAALFKAFVQAKA